MYLPIILEPSLNKSSLAEIRSNIRKLETDFSRNIQASIRETAGNLDKLFSKYYDTYVDKASDVFGETASALFSGDVAGLGGFVDDQGRKTVHRIMI